MLKNQENKNKLGITNSKKQGMKFTQKIVKTKDLGDISLDLSKEQEIMSKTPGLMENSMIENITAMNSIFAQKQSERLGLNDFNNINNSQNNTINNSNQTFNELVSSGISGANSMNSENPLDMAVIIKDSEEVKQEEEKKKAKKKKIIKRKRKSKKKKNTIFNKMTFLIVILLIIIILLIIGLVKTYLSVVRD